MPHPHAPSTFRRSFAVASWPLLALGLAACQPDVPDLDEHESETEGASIGDPPSTPAGPDGDGTTAGLDTGSSGSDGSSGELDMPLPDAPELTLGFSQVKQFDFAWAPVAGADHYRILESERPGEPFEPVTGHVTATSISLTMPLVGRYQASYVLSACNATGCTDSEPVAVASSLAEAVGYFKASNTGMNDLFGHAVALSGDGTTLAVGASREDGGSSGIDGDQADDSMTDAGAVYVFVRDEEGGWVQQAYIKGSNPAEGDQFGAGFQGRSLALGRDGSTLAIGAWAKDGSATGIDDAPYSGAVYVFVRDGEGRWTEQAQLEASDADESDAFGAAVALSSDGGVLAVGAPYGAPGIDEAGDEPADPTSRPGVVYVFTRGAMGQWAQQAQLEASNAGAGDELGRSVALSGSGHVLVAGAPGEDGSGSGIDADQADDAAPDAGAVYVFAHDGAGGWAQQAYVKAPSPGADDQLGWSVAIDLDGDTLAIGAPGQASGIGGSLPDAGAVHVLVRDEAGEWVQQAYIEASNADADDRFGQSVALSDDGSTLAVGAHHEASHASGIGGDQDDDAAGTAGAVYVLVRDAYEQWSQQAYVKAPNPSATPRGDRFGWSVALNGSGSTLAVGAPFEDGGATGIGGDASDDSVQSSGAVYLY